MKYYKLIYQNNYKLTGNYPQIDGYILDSKVKNFDSKLDYFNTYTGVEVESIPDLEKLKFGLKSKKTDFISCSLGIPQDHIVSKDVISILKSQKLSSAQIFKFNLEINFKSYEYFWFHFVDKIVDNIDFKLSLFETSNEKNIVFQNYKEYRELYSKEFASLNPVKIFIKSEKLDFFCISYLTKGTIVSEKLFNKFKEKSISGVDFELIDFIEFV